MAVNVTIKAGYWTEGSLHGFSDGARRTLSYTMLDGQTMDTPTPRSITVQFVVWGNNCIVQFYACENDGRLIRLNPATAAERTVILWGPAGERQVVAGLAENRAILMPGEPKLFIGALRQFPMINVALCDSNKAAITLGILTKDFGTAFDKFVR